MDRRLNFLRQPPQDNNKLPVTTTFSHCAPGASGKVSVVYWPAKEGVSKSPTQLTLFILGNPGLLGYYIPFLQHLYSLLPPTHAILSTSHIGHDPDIPAPEIPVELQGQLKSKIELIQALRSSLDAWAEDQQSPKSKLALMGHSLGAWLLCEAMKQLNEEERVIHAGYMLFPSLGWLSETYNGRTLWPMFHRPILPLLANLSFALRPILPFTNHPPTTLSLLRSPRSIHHVLQLGRSEMLGIRDLDVDWFASQASIPLPEGLFGVWSAGNLDGWVGRDGALVQAALRGEDGGRVTLLQGIPHAFCLREDHSKIVASVVAKWIDPSIPILPLEGILLDNQKRLEENIVPM
ncbi:hypothetical protein M231_02617 [Tremella mesenterica]|uniref:AB hydrolase-1 domain-containing protein n=1 Tax=Tremella mesenterica TaxID=5217 RepID=A0A4Q1BQF8_TREME|nr:uncharacterized protein TREMEDRAFT_28865 [Tremella mesenterica DSM 1558]EIW70730.1 hypothetical protein TREMEDRAFT_28865 [Tremella mesenterica DSM 1558]RXK40159.1 hypothetical protein M231_02617 [Tremella mesenterica]